MMRFTKLNAYYYARQELHHDTPLSPPLTRGEIKGGVAAKDFSFGRALYNRVCWVDDRAA